MSVSRQQIKGKYLSNRAIEGAIFNKSYVEDLEMIVVIPSYSEENLLQTLESLMSCEKPKGNIEVLILLNGSEEEQGYLETLHISQMEGLSTLSSQSPDWMTIRAAERYFVPKLAGVGIARKVLMDESVRRFIACRRDGLIINLDADCLVSPKYLCDIQEHFLENPETKAACIGFTHRNLHNRIIDYEIHMRMMRLGLEKALSPYAFHAVGSAMVVRDVDYCRQGGMNKRKAGEDFYFLHKFSELSQLSELKNVLVFPDSRESDRVPFGTGRAMLNSKNGIEIQTYSVEIYKHLAELLEFFQTQLNSEFSNLSLANREFLKQWDFQNKLLEIKTNVSSNEALIKRMMRKFNAFQTMKYKNYLRDHYFPSIAVIQAAEAFFSWYGWNSSHDRLEVLEVLIKADLGITF